MKEIEIGTRVVVMEIEADHHVRTPKYVRGKTGVVVDSVGAYRNPEQLAYGQDGLPRLALYRVGFRQSDLWPDYAGEEIDTAVVEIYESWLKPVQPNVLPSV